MSDLRTAAQQALEARDGGEVKWFANGRLMDNLRAALKQPEQEPVAWMTPGQDLHLNNGEGFRFSDWTPLYTHPPRREWRGLTEEEHEKAINVCLHVGVEGLVLWLEDKLRDRNA
jgi:hypothetical protein